MKKKILSAVLAALVLTFSFAGCGKEDVKKPSSDPDGTTSAVQTTSVPGTTETTSAGQEQTTAAEEKKEPLQATLQIQELDKTSRAGTMEPEYRCDSSDYERNLVVVADKDLPDFKIFMVTSVGSGADGEAVYAAEEIYSRGPLPAHELTCFEMTIFGDTPTYAVGYTETDGTIAAYGVSLSGNTGKIVLTPAKLDVTDLPVFNGLE